MPENLDFIRWLLRKGVFKDACEKFVLGQAAAPCGGYV
jgi:hypothetical protein